KDRPSWKDRMSSAAREFGSVPLWLLEISSLTMVGGAIFMLLVDPAGGAPPHGLGRTVVALSGIALFGLAAAFFMRLIVLRRESHLRAIVQEAVRQEFDRSAGRE